MHAHVPRSEGSGNLGDDRLNALLISDLHLDTNTPILTEILVKFLRSQARSVPALFLLGDIFEAWVGDDDDSKLVDDIAAELRAVADSGTAVYFMHGNRDFLLGQQYAERAGMALIDDPSVFRLGGIETLLTHGDRYCSTELEYQKFRRESRMPEWKAAILACPLDIRRALAQKLRQESITSQQAKLMAGESLADVVDAEVIKDLNEFHVKRVIHGHTHRPREHEHVLADGSVAERIVLADWRSSGEALEVRENGTYIRHQLILNEDFKQ